MEKFKKKPTVIEATQFNYIDGFDGVETCKLAESLGLSRKRPFPYSKCWEIETVKGWYIVYDGYWVITDVLGDKYPCNPEVFELTYEAI